MRVFHVLVEHRIIGAMLYPSPGRDRSRYNSDREVDCRLITYRSAEVAIDRHEAAAAVGERHANLCNPRITLTLPYSDFV